PLSTDTSLLDGAATRRENRHPFAPEGAAIPLSIWRLGAAQGPPHKWVDGGGGPSGSPPGPFSNVSGLTAGCWPTPGLLQSHTPSGKAAYNRASCAALNVAGR